MEFPAITDFVCMILKSAFYSDVKKILSRYFCFLLTFLFFCKGWKCKNYGHRTGDKECPLFTSGNAAIEKFREVDNG